MSILQQGDCHQNIERIVDQEVKKRAFQEWSMDALNLSEDVTIDPGELIRIRDAYKNTCSLIPGCWSNLIKQCLR